MSNVTTAAAATPAKRNLRATPRKNYTARAYNKEIGDGIRFLSRTPVSSSKAPVRFPKTVKKPRTPASEPHGGAGRAVDDEEVCEMGEGDARLTACARNESREETLYRLLRGEPIAPNVLAATFPCPPDKLLALVSGLQATFPTLASTIERAGGQSKNFDYTFHDGTAIRRVELKSAKTSSGQETLSQKPWAAYGQFVQFFLNNKQPEYRDLLSFAKPMLEAWHREVVVPVLMPHFGIDSRGASAEAYFKGVFSYSAFQKGRIIATGPDTELLQRFLTLCKETADTAADRKFVADTWKAFLTEYLRRPEFDMPIDALRDVIRGVLAKKDYWICLTSRDAYFLSGPKVVDLTFESVKVGKDVPTLSYTLTLEGPESAQYKVPMEFRLTWRNCAQGTFMLACQIS